MCISNHYSLKHPSEWRSVWKTQVAFAVPRSDNTATVGSNMLQWLTFEKAAIAETLYFSFNIYKHFVYMDLKRKYSKLYSLIILNCFFAVINLPFLNCLVIVKHILCTFKCIFSFIHYCHLLYRNKKLFFKKITDCIKGFPSMHYKL